MEEVYDEKVVIVLSYAGKHIGKCVLISVSVSPSLNRLRWILARVGTMERSLRNFWTPLLVMANPFSNIDLRASSMARRLWALSIRGLRFRASDRVPMPDIFFFLIKHRGQGAAPRFLIVDNNALIPYQHCSSDDLVDITYFSG